MVVVGRVGWSDRVGEEGEGGSDSEMGRDRQRDGGMERGRKGEGERSERWSLHSSLFYTLGRRASGVSE